MHRISRALTAFGLAASFLALAPHPAHANGASKALAKVCEGPSDEGKRRVLVSNFTKKWAIKQTSRRENWSGQRRNLTFEAGKTNSVTNSVSKSVQASGEAGIAWAKLSVQAGVALEDIGTVTSYEKFTETISLPSGDVYYYSRGARQFHTSVKVQECNWGQPTRRGWITIAKGSATAWEYVDTWIGCHQSVPKGTYSAFLKASHC